MHKQIRYKNNKVWPEIDDNDVYYNFSPNYFSHSLHFLWDCLFMFILLEKFWQNLSLCVSQLVDNNKNKMVAGYSAGWRKLTVDVLHNFLVSYCFLILFWAEYFFTKKKKGQLRPVLFFRILFHKYILCPYNIRPKLSSALYMKNVKFLILRIRIQKMQQSQLGFYLGELITRKIQGDMPLTIVHMIFLYPCICTYVCIVRRA